MRLGIVAAAGALALFAAPRAMANGRFPASNQIGFSPGDPNLVVLRTTFGILVSHDGGTSWQWLCEDVLGILSSSTEDPLLGLTARSIVATPGAANGLVVSPDSGCNWTATAGPLAGQLVKDLVVRPDAPDVVLALTSTYGLHAGPDGGTGYMQQVFESADDGATWAALGAPIDPGALAATIEVAASDSNRIYVSAVRIPGQLASLFVSTDAGASWTERPVPIDPVETAIYVGAVDPTDPDLVYIRTDGPSSRLLVTADGGQTFAAALTLDSPMLGFALSPDGSKVYAGDADQGLFVATREGLSSPLAFQNVSTIRVQCLATHGTDLWACSDDSSGFLAGSSSDDGAHFAAKVHLVAQPILACPADAGAALQCSGAPRQAFCGIVPDCEDGGQGEGGAATAPRAPTSTGACGCSTAGHEGGTGALAIGAGCAIVTWTARGRVRSSRRGPRRRGARGTR